MWNYLKYNILIVFIGIVINFAFTYIILFYNWFLKKGSKYSNVLILPRFKVPKRFQKGSKKVPNNIPRHRVLQKGKKDENYYRLKNEQPKAFIIIKFVSGSSAILCCWKINLSKTCPFFINLPKCSITTPFFFFPRLGVVSTI